MPVPRPVPRPAARPAVAGPRARSPRLGAVLVLAVLVLLATATVASAHPGFRPGEVPAGGPVDVELVIEHSCAAGGGEPVEGEEASPTVLVAMQDTDTFTILPRPVPGWSIVSEGDEVRWEATDGGEAGELVLPAVVEVVGDPGDEVPQPLYQECANGEFFRWAAGPDEDGDPAINLSVAAGDPSPLATPAPNPPPAASAPAAPPPTPTPTPTRAPASAAPSPSAAPVEPTPATTPTAAPTSTPTSVTSASTSPSTSPGVQAAAEDDDDEGGLNPAMWAAILVAAFAGVAGVGIAARDRDGADRDDQETP